MMKVKQIKTDNNDAKIDEKQFMKWIKALRSGKFKQGKGALQTEQGYCCLGVACAVLIPEGRQEISCKMLEGEMPRDQPQSPDWLKDISNDFVQRQIRAQRGYSGAEQSLTGLNDSTAADFDEIADLLELVYVHGMLEEK